MLGGTVVTAGSGAPPVAGVHPAFDNGRQLFVFKNPAGRDVGMEFGDVGCVRISFAINSNPFTAHSD